MATLQVKGMEDQLYAALKRRAELRNRSISQEVVSILKDYLSQNQGNAERVTEAFLSLSNDWEGKETADQLIENIRESRYRRGREEHVFD